MRKSATLNVVSKLSFIKKDSTDLFYRNPCTNLLQYLEIPLFEDHEIFSPCLNALSISENLFVPKLDYYIGSIMKSISVNKLPNHDLPEVAFVGRSNAGKSSLIKAIVKNVPDLKIKTSRKPGHTKCFNFFQVGNRLCLVDMPGYGKNQPAWFESEVTSYWKCRKNLVKTFILTDGQIELQELDKNTMQFLETCRIPYAIVMTKIDKASDSRRLKNLLLFKKYKKEHDLLSCFPHPFMLSSTTYEGLGYFLAYLGHITGNLNLLE